MRDVWDDLPDETLRRAVETCEQFADDLATAEELRAARDSADGTYEGNGDIIADHSAIAIADLCNSAPSFPTGEGASAGIYAVAAEVRLGQGISWHVAQKQAKQLYCLLLGDIFSNPFRPVTFSPSWLTPTAVGRAEGIYADRAFDRLPILADALQDAGCEDEQVLSHCRGDGPHVRGCWVVDGVLSWPPGL